MKSSILGGLALLGAGAFTAPDPEPNPKTVDLGYAVHRALLKETEGFYTFKNIRYGDPPTDDLRFRPPVPVSTKNRTVQDGSIGFKCPQAYPRWALLKEAAKAGITPEQLHQVILNDPKANEDCLFLDVVVPRTAFDNAEQTQDTPVLVWLHGGGYVFGYKDQAIYDPSGLMARSKLNGSHGVIFIAVNYRLGLFGWLNGNKDKSVFPNAGLHDQRLALSWIEKYVGLFGGDKDQITVMGQSAGAGSIIHHITGEGGNTTLPFNQAILQSPGWEYIDKESVWDRVLSVANELVNATVTNGIELAALGFRALNQLNGALVFGSANGSFTFSPSVDDGYVPDYPNVLLYQGKFNSNTELLVGHTANEAGLFVSPDVDTEEELRQGLEHTFNGFLPDGVDYILTELYPSPSKTDLYKTEYERTCLIVAESSFVCNTGGLALAFGNRTRNYRFDIPPAVHSQDIPWTFYHGNDTTVIPEVAEMMQTYFGAFALKGDPNFGHGLPEWPEYGNGSSIVAFGTNGARNTVDDARNKRCDFWQSGEYRREN